VYARSAFSLVTACTAREQVQDAVGCQQDLRWLSEQVPDDASIARYRTEAAAQLTSLPLPLSHLEELFGELRALHEAHPGVHEFLAEGAARLAPRYAHAERWAQARELYGWLVRFAREHPGDQDVAECMGGAAANVAVAFLKHGWFAEAQELHAQLEEIAREAPSPTLRSVQAHSAKNLAIHAASEERMAEARRYFQEVAALTVADPSAPLEPPIAAALRGSFASAAAALVRALGGAGLDDEARETYERLHALAWNYPSEEKLFDEAGRAACMLIWDYLHHHRTWDIVRLYERVRDYPGFPCMAQWRAKAGADVVWQLWYADDPATLIRSFDEHHAFCLGAAGDADVREWFARTAARISGQWQESSAFRVREAIAQSQGVSFEQIAAAMPHMAIDSLRDPVMNVDDDALAPRMRTLYRDLGELSRAYPDDTELRDARASMALKLATTLWSLFSLRFPALLMLPPGVESEEAFRAWRQNVHAEYGSFLGGAGGAELAELHRDLAGLYGSHPGNAAIRAQYGRSLGLMLGLEYYAP
ncbi:MAG TPA: hypothetical protein VK689_19465, partial [Armatimonadota bacterium]|nr:hypothetical protein [Armatimonadota bacterium]